MLTNDNIRNKNPFARMPKMAYTDKNTDYCHFLAHIYDEFVENDVVGFNIWGLPQSGKTTLLANLVSLAQQRYTSDRVLATTVMLTSIPNKDLIGIYKTVIDRLESLVSSLEPELHLQVTDIYRRHRLNDSLELYLGINRILNKLAAYQVKVLLCFDDFDLVLSHFPREQIVELSQNLKSLRAECTNLTYIFSTQIDFQSLYQIHGLDELSSSIHLQITEQNYIYPLKVPSHRDNSVFIKHVFNDIPIQDSEIDTLLDLVGNYPRALQIGGYYLYEAIQSSSVGVWDYVTEKVNSDRQLRILYSQFINWVEQVENLAHIWSANINDEDSQGIDIKRFLTEVNNESHASSVTQKLLSLLVSAGLLAHDTEMDEYYLFSEAFATHLKETNDYRGLNEQPEEIEKRSSCDSIEFAEFGEIVIVNGREVALSSTEYKLLKELAEHPGTLIAKDRLEQAIWGTDTELDASSLGQLVVRLRKKIEENYRKPKLIMNVRGEGYFLSEMN